MNKKFIYLMMTLFSFALLASCNKDDDDTNSISDYASEVQGTYRGNLNLKITDLNFEELMPNKDITLTRTGENKIKLSLKDFIFNQQNLGNIIVNDVAVTKEGDSIIVSGKTEDIGLLGYIVTATVYLSPSSIKSGTLNMNIKVKNVKVVGQNPSPNFEEMNITYSGNILK